MRRDKYYVIQPNHRDMSKTYLNLIDTTTLPRCDVTPLFADPTAFQEVVGDLSEMVRDVSPTVICGIDALGFILGSSLAHKLRLGFIAVRKAGKLPGPVNTETFIDYSGTQKSLEIRQGILKSSDRALIVDEWVETGAQVLATMALIDRAGAAVVGVAALNFDPRGIDGISARAPCFALLKSILGNKPTERTSKLGAH